MPPSPTDLKLHYITEEIHTFATYAGCLEGLPDPEDWLSRLENLVNLKYTYDKDYPLVVVAPQIIEVPVQNRLSVYLYKKLPRYTHVGLYRGPTIITNDSLGDQAHASMLCVVWLDDELQSPKADKDILLEVEWDLHAKNFWY